MPRTRDFLMPGKWLCTEQKQRESSYSENCSFLWNVHSQILPTAENFDLDIKNLIFANH